MNFSVAEIDRLCRAAASDALKSAADELARLQYVRPDSPGRAEYEQLLAIRRGNTDEWLRERAKQIYP